MDSFAPKSGDGVRAACKKCGYGKIIDNQICVIPQSLTLFLQMYFC